MYSSRTVGGGALVGALAATGASAAPLAALIVLASAAILVGGFCLWRTSRLRRRPLPAGNGDRRP